MPFDASAAKRSKRKKVKADEEVLSSENGYDCYKNKKGKIVSGKVVVKKKGTFFQVYRLKAKQKKALKRAQKKVKKLNRILNRKGELNAKKQALLERMQSKITNLSAKERANTCTELFEGGNTENPAKPAANFTPYTGKFGIAEAQRLYTRFGYGASRADLNRAVSEGLTATVERLLTWQDEPSVEADALDIQCDEYLEREELYFDDDPDDDNQECNPNDPTDFDSEGFIQGMLYKRQHTSNPVFYRVVDLFHDERMAAQCGAAVDSQYHFRTKHFAFLESVAKAMDYAKYIREVKDDPLVAYLNLDLGENSVFNNLQSPNENFAREWLELATTSPTYKGEAVYTPFDIAQLALALTGKGYNTQPVTVGYEDGEEQTVQLTSAVDVPDAFVGGEKTIFMGTAFQQTIVDDEDAADAILSHPATYYHFAEELLQEFLLPNPSEGSIEVIAADIQKDGGKFKNALRRIMLSQEFFNESNKNSLVKSPMELLIGFLRQTEFPYSVRNLRNNLDDLGFLLCSPGNRNAGQIFGWDNLRTASEAFVIERRNKIIDMMNYERNNLPEEWEYSLYEVFVKDLPESFSPAESLALTTAELMGIELNSRQLEEVVKYLNYNYETCNGNEDDLFGCVEGEKFLKREAFDPSPDAYEHLLEDKVRGLLVLFATSDEYNLR